MEKLTKEETLEILILMIDKKYQRKSRRQKIDPIRLKHTITLWAISQDQYFGEYDPKIVVNKLKELVSEGIVETNISEESNLHPFDTYFIPKIELEGYKK